MTFDQEKLKRLDMSFLGFLFGYESWELSTYLEVLDEHISFA